MIFQRLKYSFAARFSSSLLLLVGLIFSITFIVFFIFTNRIVKSKMERNAYLTLHLLDKEIETVLNEVENGPNNLKQIIFSKQNYYELTDITVRSNPFIFGSAIAFEPNYFPKEGYYFSPYSWRVGDTVQTKQLGTPTYNYFEMDWYKIPKKINANYWTNSYYDEEGGNIGMITYSAPFRDKQGRFAGVFTADLSLAWLNELVKNKLSGDKVSIMILGRDSSVLVSQGKAQVLDQCVFAITQSISSQSVNSNFFNNVSASDFLKSLPHLYKDTVFNTDNDKKYVYYTYIPETGWTIFMLVPQEVVYNELFLPRIILLAVGIIGLILIFVFSISVVKRNIKPLKQFAISARQIAQGQLNINLPQISSEDEIADLSKAFRYMQSELLEYIENLKITTAEKERTDSELRIARELQMSMLSKKCPEEVDLYSVLRPAKLVGGDLYDFFIRDEKLYFIIGDVSGKGVPAAILMAVTLSMFRAFSTHTDVIGNIVSLMNKIATEKNEQNMFVTLFAGILDLQTGALSYCNAGHDPLIVAGKSEQYLQRLPNLPIGIVSDFTYQSQELKLNYGETLFLYTDGVTEAENSKQELYGSKRLLGCVGKHKGENAQHLVKAVLEDVKSYVKDYEQSDDLTIMAIRLNTQLQVQETSTSMRISLKNNISEVFALQNFTEKFCKEFNIDSSLTIKLNLVLEEIISNIIFYAYPKVDICTCSEEIELNVEYINNELIFTIIDNGIPFDPTQQPPPDTASSVEERPVGGLGLFLVRQIMDEMIYQRIGNKNQLILKKTFKNIDYESRY